MPDDSLYNRPITPELSPFRRWMFRHEDTRTLFTFPLWWFASMWCISQLFSYPPEWFVAVLCSVPIAHWIVHRRSEKWYLRVPLWKLLVHYLVIFGLLWAWGYLR